MTDHRPARERRPVNSAYLVLGLVLLGLAGSWLLREAGVMDADGFQWLLPLILVVAGAAGLLTSLAKGVSRRAQRPALEDSDPFLQG